MVDPKRRLWRLITADSDFFRQRPRRASLRGLCFGSWALNTDSFVRGLSTISVAAETPLEASRFLGIGRSSFC